MNSLPRVHRGVDLSRAALCLLTLFAPVAAQDRGERSVAWLAENAVRFDFDRRGADDFSDLMPLRDRFRKMRCVALGEAQHGDGTSFVAKARLVRFLHQNCGFDVLVFESGMWDCAQAWKAMRRGGDAAKNAEEGVFGIWTKSRQCFPLWRYVQRSAKSEHPLELAGFDCQLTGRAARRIPAELGAEIAAQTSLDAAQVTGTLAKIVEELQVSEVPVSEAADTSLKDLDRALAKAKPTREVAALRRYLASLRGAIASKASRKGSGLPARFNPRDRAMAANLESLLEKRYPKRKLILWAATMHVVRKAEGIQFAMTKNYRGVRPLGSYVAKQLGKDYYVIGFDCAEGKTGFPWQAARELRPAPRGSFAALAKRAGLGGAFVEVRGAKGDNPFARKCIARPLGHTAMRARWPAHLDAMVYIPKMEPSRLLVDAKARASVRDPVDVFRERWSQSKRRIATGHAYAEKGDMTIPWQRWVDAKMPKPDEIRALQARFEDWARAQAASPSFAWRAASLRAAMADRLGEHDRARAEHARAIEAYPNRSFAKPSRTSSFQHLVNAAAEHALRTEGLSAAIATIAKPLASDPRYQFFFVAPWKSRLEKTQRRRFVAALLRAFEARAKRFPESAAAIRSRAQGLRSELGG